MTDAPAIYQGDSRAIDSIMPVMAAAFDPAFGEAWTADQCAGFLTLPGTCLFIAHKANKVVGFAVARYVFEEAELLLIAVHPQAQGQGIGRDLINTIIGWASTHGAKTVFLEVREGNQALVLYSQMGFAKIGSRKNYYRGVDGITRDAITLQKTINL
jgi:ribosomal-protein-alanine N-acetyltransferase